MKGKGHDHVYVSLTYATGRGGPFPNATAIRRYTYDAGSGKLVAPLDILKGLPASQDHQSARLLLGPDRTLYYAIGDQGANQRAYLCEPNQAQTLPTAAQVAAADWSSYQGKILRIHLDGSIPADNPVIRGVRSHIYARGIRNTQGMVFTAQGKLFAVDQGPGSDDELNIILPGRNYGWPHVSGYKDDAAYAYANFSAAQGGCSNLSQAQRDGLMPPPQVPVQQESEWPDADHVEPLKTFFTVGNGHDFRNPWCAEHGFFNTCWPTIAPSSVAYYPAGQGAPGWGHSLLITSLKRGMLYRVQLDESGTRPTGAAQPVLRTPNRYREVVVSPDGRTLYVATDSTGVGTTDDGRGTRALANPGAILAFRYLMPPAGR
jgi:PQQ-dependent dehydrogenase (s-GDH family)